MLINHGFTPCDVDVGPATFDGMVLGYTNRFVQAGQLGAYGGREPLSVRPLAGLFVQYAPARTTSLSAEILSV
jgi:hypothetical protein